MSFKINLKKTDKGFAVRLRSYKLEDRIAAGKEDRDYVEKYLPVSEWHRYGFHQSMTYEEAKELLLSINSQAKLNDSKERKARFKYLEQKEHKELLKSAYLPQYLVNEFEKKLKDNSFSQDYEKSKTYFHWKTTMRVISELDIAPGEWAENKRTVIRKLEGYAPSTVSKIISFMNHYGEFYSKKMGKYYEKLSMPRGVEIGRISDKYMDKTGGKTKEAKGISLAMMEILKDSNELTQEEINWCIVCLGFGLRPSEMDVVATRDSKTLTIGKNTVKIYQSKLVSLPRHLRFKEVAIKHTFQKDAYHIIKSNKSLIAPSIYMLKKVLGDEYGLYSFRKGYTDIMLGLSESMERISMDLGHSSIDRTWKSYRKRISAN
jgi:hypothetical protein